MRSEALANAGNHLLISAYARSQQYMYITYLVSCLTPKLPCVMILHNLPSFLEANFKRFSDGPTNVLSIRQLTQ